MTELENFMRTGASGILAIGGVMSGAATAGLTALAMGAPVSPTLAILGAAAVGATTTWGLFNAAGTISPQDAQFREDRREHHDALRARHENRAAIEGLEGEAATIAPRAARAEDLDRNWFRDPRAAPDIEPMSHLERGIRSVVSSGLSIAAPIVGPVATYAFLTSPDVVTGAKFAAAGVGAAIAVNVARHFADPETTLDRRAFYAAYDAKEQNAASMRSLEGEARSLVPGGNEPAFAAPALR